MIETDALVKEMLGVIGYARQTLALHADQASKVQKHLSSEQNRLVTVIEKRERQFNIIDRIVVY